MKIYGYTRISVDLQEDNQENTSIENQKRIIKDYVGKNFPDAELQIFEDRDRSGYTFTQREQYQKMRKDLLCGNVKILIVKDFSRFSRRNGQGLVELEALRDAGVRIISIGDNIDYPTQNEWMLIQFKFLVNELPVTDTSQKIKHIIANRQKSGQWVCSVPYGYRMTNTKEMIYEIDPPAAEIVRDIFRFYNNGWGYKKIANHLTEEGKPTPRTNEISQKESEGKPTKLKAKTVWSIATVSSILKNDFYIGTLRQKKYTRKGINGKDTRVNSEDQVVIENAHSPIIDTKTFAYTMEQHNKRTTGNYRGEKKYSNDYSGFLFCGDCGSPMFSMSRPDLSAAYICGAYHRRGLKGCTSHHIRVDLLDKVLKAYILRVRDNCENMITVLEQAIKEQPKREEELGLTIESVESQIIDAKEQLKENYKKQALLSLGKIDAKYDVKKQVLVEMENELSERIVGLEKQIAETSNMRNAVIKTNRKAKTVIDVFNDVLQKEKLDKRDIGIIIDRITVYENHLNVKLKADVDELLSLENKEDIVNFPEGSKDIEKDIIVQSSAKRLDKVFTVNVVNSGDPLEIYTDNNGEVIFKKYSPIGEMASFATSLADSVAAQSELPVLVFDRDHCIAAAGITRREVVERRISQQAEELMEARRSYSAGDGVLQPVEGVDRTAAVLVPIIASGDIVGAVVMLSKGDSRPPEQSDVKLCTAAAAFLGTQMEE